LVGWFIQAITDQSACEEDNYEGKTCLQLNCKAQNSH
jgi:hypothetical protein